MLGLYSFRKKAPNFHKAIKNMAERFKNNGDEKGHRWVECTQVRTKQGTLGLLAVIFCFMKIYGFNDTPRHKWSNEKI